MAILLCYARLWGQSGAFPFRESFDQTLAPTLPEGWHASRLKTPAHSDVVLSTSGARTAPNALLMTNATDGQFVAAPALNFHDRMPGTLSFYCRRSASFRARVIVEVSTDSGRSYSLGVGYVEPGSGSAGYDKWESPIPSGLAGIERGMIRWRILPDTAGNSGTFRIDDVVVTVQMPFDLAISSIRWQTLPVREGEPAILVAALKNQGYLRSPSWKVLVYGGTNGSVTHDEQNIIGRSANGTPIDAHDSQEVTVVLTGLQPGRQRIRAYIDSPGDNDPDNNFIDTTTSVRFRTGGVFINEIMAEPKSGHAEYIEIANVGTEPVNLEECALVKPLTSHPRVTILSTTLNPLILPPGGFLVLSGDSSIVGQFGMPIADPKARLAIIGAEGLSLKNEGDTFVLRDADGEMIDSITYSAAWHNPSVADPAGKSLERVRSAGVTNDPSNWSTSSDPRGGTPGRRNSISVQAIPTSSRLVCIPNPFSPDFDGRDDFTVVHYELPIRASAIGVRIYDVRGRLVRVLVNNGAAGAKGEILWDGRDDDHRRARIGIYVVVLEAIDGVNGMMESAKCAVVVAGKL